MRPLVLAPLALAACAARGPSMPPAAASVAVPPVGPSFGTAAPTIVLDHDPSERWVALCQAREDTDGDGAIAVWAGQHGEVFGDAMTPYLVVGGGPGFAIDDFLASTDDGRWLAYRRTGRLLLRDAARDIETDLTALGADASEDGAPLGPPRAVSFSPDGASLAYLRARGRRTGVVVRALDGGAERELDPGPGLLWRVAFAGGGRWIDALVVTADRNGDGRVEAPQPRTTLAGGECRAEPGSYGVYGWTGDAPTHRLLPVAGGAPLELDEPLAVWGDVVLARVGGALVLVAQDGARRELVPSSCAARIDARDDAAGRALFVCAAGPTRGQAAYLSADGVAPAGFPLDVPHEDSAEQGRFVWRGALGQLIDLEARRTVSPGGEWELTVGTRALVWRGAGYVVRDFAGGNDTPLPAGILRYSFPRRLRSAVYLGGWLVDVAHARVLGHTSAPPIGVSTAGRALTFTREDGGFDVGPVVWRPVSPAGGAPGG